MFALLLNMPMNYKGALINGLVIAATLTAAAGENHAVPTSISSPGPSGRPEVTFTTGVQQQQQQQQQQG